MSKLLRTFNLLAICFSLLATSQVRAQTSNCRIILSELNQPVACASGTYTVRFDVSCPLGTTYRIEVTPQQSFQPYFLFDGAHDVVDTLVSSAPYTINLPPDLDTNAVYGIKVCQVLASGQIGICSNIKTFTVRQVDRSPKPESIISILQPIKAIYCPKDTIIFQIESINILNNNPPATYQWLLNGTAITGADRPTLRYSGFHHGDCISLLVTKGNPCAFNDTGSSNKICPNIKQEPTIQVRLLSGSGCADSLSVYKADTMNIGRGGSFQWFLGNVAIAGAMGITYTLQPGQAVCREVIFARAFIVDCPDTVKSNELRVNSCGKVTVNSVTPPSFCAGADVTITYSTLACFDPANAFLFELSDAAGNFGSPTLIGSVADTNGGSVTLTTPTSLVAGTGYRLRIRSTAPVGVSNSFGTLTVFALPTAPTAAPAVRCGPGRITLSVSAPGASSYAWFLTATTDDLVTRPNGSAVTTDTFSLFVSRDTVFYVAAISAQGCTSAVRTPAAVRVGAPITVSAGPNQTACQAGPCIDLLGGSPAGGTFSGAVGVVGNTFCPGTLAPGVFTVQYRYVTLEGCRDSATKQITIDTVPVPNAGTQDSSVCKPGPPLTFQLRGFSPAGGTWEGSAAVTSTGVVTPALLSVPGPDTLRYKITVGNCSRSDFRVLRAIPVPAFTISTTKPRACRSRTGSATLNPFDATWTISVVNALGLPAGVRSGPRIDSLAAGTYTITVTANPGGCQTTQDFVITDTAGPVTQINGLAATYCTSDPCVALTATPPGGIYSSSQATVVDATTGLFCPNAASAGTLRVFYAVTDLVSGCVGADTATTQINQSPGIAPEADTTVCGNSPRFALASGGTWLPVPGVVLDAGRYYFDPSVSGVSTVNILTHQVIAAGCTTQVNKTVIVNPIPQITLSPSGQTHICRGSTVTITASVVPPGGFAFVWLRNGSTYTNTSIPQITVNRAGIYTLRLIDTTGLLCSFTSSSSIEVIVDSVSGLSAGVDTSLCRNGSPYQLVGTPAGGTFSGLGLSPGGSTFDPSTQSVGTYTLFYRLASGVCIDSAAVRITVRDAVTAGLSVDNAQVCGTSATLRATPTGSFRYTFFRNRVVVGTAGQAGPIFEADSSGSYTVLVQPLTGAACADTSPAVQVLISTPPTLPVLTNLSLCQGDPSVSLPSSSQPGVTTAWRDPSGNTSNAGGNYFFNPATPGSFPLTVVLTSGACADSATITADVGRKPAFTVQVENATTCGTADGRATITPIAPRVRYVLVGNGGGGNPPNFVGLRPGVYNIIATDSGSGCQTVQTFTVSSPDNFRARIRPLPRTIFCRNDSAIALSALPDSGNFSYTAVVGGSTGELGAGIFNPGLLNPGDYLLTYAVDSGICTGRDTVNFTIRPVPVASIAPAGPLTLCQGRTVKLLADGGTGGNVYQFNDQNGVITGATQQSFSASASGFYTVTVTNGGCSSTSQQVTVTVQPSPGAGITALPDSNACQGRAVTLVATGNGTTYIWSGPNGIITPTTPNTIQATTAGTYQVIVSNGTCADTARKQLSFAPRIQLAVTSTPAQLSPCQGDSARFAARAPGALLSISPGGLTGTGTIRFATITPGLYTLSASLGACDTSIQFTVAPTARPDTTVNVTGNTRFCTGGSVTLTATDPNAFARWRDPSGAVSVVRSITASTPGRYTLLLSTQPNGAGCIDSVSRTVIVDTVPRAVVSPAGPLSVCQNQPVQLTANSGIGLRYQWLNGPGTLPGDTQNIYNVNTAQAGDQTLLVEVTTAAGCSARSLPVQVQVKTTPQASLTAIGGTNICQGQTVTLAGNTFSSAEAGFLRTDSGRTTTIAAPTPPTPPVIQVGQRGLYSFVLTLNGCSDTSSPVAVRIPNLAMVTAPANQQICISAPSFQVTGFSPPFGNTVSIESPGVAPGTDIFNPLTAGIGRKPLVIVLTDSGCQVRDTAYFTVVPGFSTSINPASTLVCAQTAITLAAVIDPPTPGADYTFQWRHTLAGVTSDIPGAVDSTYLANDSGTYYVVATVATCQSLSTPSQITYYPFTAPFAGRNLSLCQGGGAVQLTGASPAGGSFSGAGVDSTGLFTPGAPGSTRIIYNTNQNGCVLKDTLTIYVNSLPTVKASYASSVTGAQDPLDILDSAKLSAAVTGNVVSYAWSSPGGALSNSASPEVSPAVTTVYSVMVRTDSGCQATDTVTVKVRTDVRVANGFSPNGDGQNDYWNIYNIQAYPDADIRVYNRWGAMLYHAKGSDFTLAKGFDAYWKGDDGKGNAVPTSVYYYTIDLKNNTKPFVGSITVAR